MDQAELQKRILAAFQTESDEQLSVLRHLIQNWPESLETQLDEAFRMAHSMKGGARVCGLTQLEADAHSLESHLSKLSSESSKAEDDSLREITSWVDRIEDQIRSIFQDTPEEVSPAPTERITSVKVAPNSAPSEVLRIDVSHFEKLLKSSDQLLFELAHLEGISQHLSQLSQEIEKWRRNQAENHHLQYSEESQQIGRLGVKLMQIREDHLHHVRSLKVLCDKVQDEVRQIGMVPVQSILEGFPRMVREVSEAEGKSVQFKMSGVEHLADRGVLQALKDPIMHAIRNSISHGIERPEVRIKNGKAPGGNIELNVETQSNELTLTIRDDGAGIDFEKLRLKVASYAGLTTEQVDLLSTEELTEYLFHPRFSTSDEVSPISGRGVGLSVVFERTKHFQGKATIHPLQIGGFELQIKVPVTISSHPLILVRANEQTYAIPQNVIHRLHRCDTFHIVDGKTTILVDKESYILATMNEAAGIESGILRNERGIFDVILLKSEPKCALHIESIVGEKHALIHPLPYPASLSPHYSGAVFLENGEIALVLSIHTMLQRFQGSALQEIKGRTSTTTKPVILLVDDSFTARTLQKSILETAGYSVYIAVDGKAAFDLARVRSFDLVVSDVQMPNMNGFELLEALKSDNNLAHLPVILVTSLSSTEDQERGFRLGAAAYIIKERFDHRELLSTIERLI